MRLAVLLIVGIAPTSTVGHGGTHGANVMGIHGIGVRIPEAAAVAAATIGFAKDIHVPKGIIFTKGIPSIMVAAGIIIEIVRLIGSTISTPGAEPKGHLSMAVMVVLSPISTPYFC
jgi:hypothetical protein